MMLRWIGQQVARTRDVALAYLEQRKRAAERANVAPHENGRISDDVLLESAREAKRSDPAGDAAKVAQPSTTTPSTTPSTKRRLELERFVGALPPDEIALVRWLVTGRKAQTGLHLPESCLAVPYNGPVPSRTVLVVRDLLLDVVQHAGLTIGETAQIENEIDGDIKGGAFVVTYLGTVKERTSEVDPMGDTKRTPVVEAWTSLANGDSNGGK